jgi:hypothetical protein
MRDRLNELASQNGRSANAEIVARLQRALNPTENAELDAVRQAVREELMAYFGTVRKPG